MTKVYIFLFIVIAESFFFGARTIAGFPPTLGIVVGCVEVFNIISYSFLIIKEVKDARPTHS
jgi:hypothetical protein